MIRTEREYQEALGRLKEDLQCIELQKQRLIELNLSEEQMQHVMEPSICFHEQLKEEVAYYERIKRGDFGAVYNLTEIGKVLIGLRIYAGLSQTDLAKRLNVSEAQVSRDERNEYHGATVDKLQKVLDAIGVRMKSEFEFICEVAV